MVMVVMVIMVVMVVMLVMVVVVNMVVIVFRTTQDRTGQDKTDLNSTFQVTCDWQLSQFL